MKNSFKILLGLFLVTFAISCSEDGVTTAVVAEKQDVVFDITNVVPQVAGRNAVAGKINVEIPECQDLEPAYAKITIDGDDYQTDVYRLDGKLYTQSIKLDATDGIPTTYTVSEFLLYADGDILIMATPEAGSDYAAYVNKPVSFTFDVNAFKKAEISIEVLCFKPQNYTYFGFTWFASTEIAVREVCFFGDICLNGEPFAPADFNGSAYGSNVAVDVTAIMKIIVKRDGVEVPNSPFKNIDALNSPLCVQYPDILNVDGEVFTFELQLWLPDGNGFSYQTYYTYTATDDGALDIAAGDDGIVDFVVGTCGVDGVANQTFDFLFVPPVPPVVTFGYSNLTEAAGMRIRGNSSGNELYLGIPDLGIGSNRVEASYPNVNANWSEGTYAVTFAYVQGDNKITMSIYNADAGSASLEYDFDVLLPPGCASTGWNTMDINVVDRLDPANLRFNNVLLDGFPLGDFGIEGWNDWTVSGFDFSQGFVLTGDMVVTGAWTGSETNKLQIIVGCL